MKHIFTLVWLSILTSCSQQRMALRFADTAASWKADDYFDLTSAQKDGVKRQLKVYFKKAYESNDREIPKLFDRAEKVFAKVDDQNKIDCGEIEKIGAESRPLFSDISKLAVADIKTLTDSLNQKQILYFFEQVAKEINENENKVTSRADLEDSRVESTLDNLEAFLGRLSTAQVAAIQAHMKANPFPFAEKLKSQKINYEKLKAVSTTPEAFQKFILDYLENWRDYQSFEYLKASDQLRLRNELFYQSLICQASVKQIKYLRQKLSDLKKDFEEFFIQD